MTTTRERALESALNTAAIHIERAWDRAHADDQARSLNCVRKEIAAALALPPDAPTALEQAAPDMLAMLRHVLRHSPLPGADKTMIAAAIARATGKGG